MLVGGSSLDARNEHCLVKYIWPATRLKICQSQEYAKPYGVDKVFKHNMLGMSSSASILQSSAM